MKHHLMGAVKMSFIARGKVIFNPSNILLTYSRSHPLPPSHMLVPLLKTINMQCPKNSYSLGNKKVMKNEERYHSQCCFIRKKSMKAKMQLKLYGKKVFASQNWLRLNKPNKFSCHILPRLNIHSVFTMICNFHSGIDQHRRYQWQPSIVWRGGLQHLNRWAHPKWIRNHAVSCHRQGKTLQHCFWAKAWLFATTKTKTSALLTQFLSGTWTHWTGPSSF